MNLAKETLPGTGGAEKWGKIKFNKFTSGLPPSFCAIFSFTLKM